MLLSIDDEASLVENLKLLGEIGEALKSGQVHMHYQPKVEARTGTVVGVEALMRWQHPVRGNVPPNEFIPYAESSTLIDEITRFAIDQSLAQLVAWEQRGLGGMTMAVNISPRNLLNPDFSQTVKQLLAAHGVDGNRLELEVTERVFVEDMDNSIVELDKLADCGVVISIDDFGTGYSSLQYLEKMPISILKIDQCFTESLPTESGSKKIVNVAIALAHNLGMAVVAEGVENQAAYDFLMAAGCDLLQGYFIGRPVAADELEQQCRTAARRLVC